MSSHVLVAESSATLQALVRVTLEGDGLQVDCVSDGRSAVSAILSRRPSLFICDAGLPGLDGYQVVEEVRRQDTTSPLPILLLASDHAAPDVDRLDHLGIQDMLTKPFEQHDLLERVRGLLGTRQPEERPEPPRAPRVPPPSAPSTPITNDISGAHLTHSQRSPMPERGPLEAPSAVEIEAWLKGPGREVLDAAIREVVWKVVPELAEAQIRDEIRRLTEPEQPERGEEEDEDA